VVDSEVGDDDSGAFGNGDNRTRPDQLLALDGGQPPSLGMGPPRAGIKVTLSLPGAVVLPWRAFAGALARTGW